MRDRKWATDLQHVWSSPLHYWRALSRAIRHGVRPSGPRDRLLNKCRKADARRERACERVRQEKR